MADKAITKIYWDSCVWIAWNNDEFGLRGLCTDILREAEAGRLAIVMSTLVLAEFGPQNPEVNNLLDDYLLRSSFTLVNVTRTIAIRARGLVEGFGIRGPDAVHIATALYANADMFYSADKRLLNRIGQRSVGIPVKWPKWPYPQMQISEIAATVDKPDKL